MTAVELAIVGAPKAFWGTEDSAAEVLHEQGGFCLVAMEDGICSFCEQALGLADSIEALSPEEGALTPPEGAGSIGALSPAEESAGSSEDGSGSALTFFTLQASQAFAAHNLFLCFSEDLPIVDNEDLSTLCKKPMIYMQEM